MRLVRMREEQGQKCMYSGKPIDMDRLLDSLTPGREFKYVETDHVLPQSRTADNSLDNQVLVLANENQRKGNRTPFEWRGQSDEAWWHQLKVTVASLPLMSTRKKAKLLLEVLNDDEFVGRNLVDTQYATRLFARMVREGLLFSGGAKAEEGNLSTESTSRERWDNLQRARVRTPQGGATAMLRGLWGLSKNRETSDLHHAVDACVIAAASPSLIARLNNYHRFKEVVLITPQGDAVWRETGELLSHEQYETFTEQEFPEPFAPHRFHQEVMTRISNDGKTYLTKKQAAKLYDFANYPPADAEAVRPIFVSRAVQQRGGEVHEQQIWGSRQDGKGGLHKYVMLRDLSAAQLKLAVGRVDPRNKWLFDAISERLAPFGDDKDAFKKAFATPIAKPSRFAERTHLIRRIKIGKTLEPSVRVREGFADIGDMLSYVLWRENGEFAIYPHYAAPIDDQRGISRPTGAGDRLGPLRRNDFLTIEWASKSDGKPPVVVAGYLHGYESDGRLTLRRHDQPRVDKRQEQFHHFRGKINQATTIRIWRFDILGHRYGGPEYRRELA